MSNELPTSATRLWVGQPSVFGSLEVEPNGSITYVYDRDLNRNVWRYFKPSDSVSYRCESRNIRVGAQAYKWQKGRTYTLNRKSKLPKIDSAYGDFVIFQWKSYPGGLQNYPLLMTAVRDEVILRFVDRGEVWKTVWTTKTQDNVWNSYSLTLHLSDIDSEGWFSLNYNGVDQLLDGKSRYAGRTMDGANEPKWGVYNRDKPEHEMEQLVADLEVLELQSVT